MSTNAGATKMPKKKDSPCDGGANCGECQQLDHSRMVQCDDCDIWHHYECVNVTDDIQNHDWSCKRCVARSLAAGQIGQTKRQQNQKQNSDTGADKKLNDNPRKKGASATSTPLSSEQRRLEELYRYNVELQDQLRKLQEAHKEEKRNHQAQMTALAKRCGQNNPLSPPQLLVLPKRSKGLRHSANIRELECKALQERSALEKRQLEERLALNRELIEKK